MMRRLMPGIVTAVLLMVTVGVAQLVRVPAPRPAGGSPAPSSSSAESTFHSTAAGLDMRLPEGWRAADRIEGFNRSTVRLVVLANGPLPVSSDLDHHLTPQSTVAVEIVQYQGPGLGLGGFGSDTTFPLDWSKAAFATDPFGDAITSLSFIQLGASFAIRAHLSFPSQTDREQLTRIVASLRPDPIPATGEYHGWQVLGPLSAFTIGAVRHYDRPPNEIGGVFVVRGEHHLFALVDKAYEMMSTPPPCPIHYNDVARLFVCDVTRETWDRTGAVVKGTGSFGLAFHPIFEKDGYVLLNVGTIGGGGVIPKEVDEFADPIAR